MNVDDLIKNYSLIDDVTSFITIINNTFNEEQKISILRNEKFINDISPLQLELILSNMKFESVFNMLQNKKILNKVNNLNVYINNPYKGLIISYLNSDSLIKKTSSIMLTKLLLNLDRNEINTYLSKKIIKEKLSNKDIIDIAVNYNILIDNLTKFTDEELYLYINKMMNNTKNIDLLNNKNMVKKVFNLNNRTLKKINFEEVKYLYETINTKSIITIQDNTYNISNYKGILSLYLIYGFNNAKKIANEMFTLNIKDANDLINNITNQKLYQFKINNYQLFDNMAHKVINELNKEDSITNIINNPYLKNVISLSRIYNQDELLNNIQCYYKNKDKNDVNIKMFHIINRLINNIYNMQKNVYYKEVKSMIIKDFNIKPNIMYNLKNKLTANYIKALKIKLLINTLNDNNKLKYQDYYKNKIDLNNVNNIYSKKLSNNKIDLDSIIKHILIPYANNYFNIDNIIETLQLDNNNDYKEIINNIINKTISFVNYYIDSFKTKMLYYKEIEEYVDNMHLNIPFNHYYFEPQKKILGINDYAKIFSGYDLNNSIIHKKSLYHFIKKNNLLISFANNYYKHTFNLGFIISNYDNIYNNYKNNITMSNINYLIYKIYNNPIMEKISIKTFNYLFNNNITNIDNILNRYANNLKINELDFPYIKGIINNVAYELIDSHNEELLKYEDNYYYLQLKDIITNKKIGIIKMKRINELLLINYDNIDNILINNIANDLLNNISNIDIIITDNNSYYGININSKLVKLPEKEYKIVCSNIDINESINNKPIINKYLRKRDKYKVISNILTNEDVINLRVIISLYNLDNNILNNNYSEIYYGDDWILTKSLTNEIKIYNQNDYNSSEINELIDTIKKVEPSVLLFKYSFRKCF